MDGERERQRENYAVWFGDDPNSSGSCMKHFAPCFANFSDTGTLLLLVDHVAEALVQF